MSVHIVYETHSISEDNERGIATGWGVCHLSARGRDLAQHLGERRRADGLAVVYSSDLARAVETATIAFAGSPIPLRQDARLRECNYGAWNGMPVARLEAERAQHVDEPFPGGESYRQVAQRMAALLADLAREWSGARVLLIGHAATRFALDHLLHGHPLEALVVAPFNWQEGWHYELPDGWQPAAPSTTLR